MSKKNHFVWISPNDVKVGDFRVRTSMNSEKLEDLKRSMSRRQLLAPIVVRKKADGYELIAGERRLIASKELGLTEIPAIIREISDEDSVLIEMGIENIQREDLSFYEKGRWVKALLDKGWLITALAQETGIPHNSLSNWLTFYQESERIKKDSSMMDEEFKPEKMPLAGLLEVKRAPISEEKKTEIAITASQMPERPSVSEIQRATRIIEQEPETSAKEAIERARGITYLLPVPADLMPKLQQQAREWELGIQEAIIRILRDYLE